MRLAALAEIGSRADRFSDSSKNSSPKNLDSNECARSTVIESSCGLRNAHSNGHQTIASTFDGPPAEQQLKLHHQCKQHTQ